MSYVSKRYPNEPIIDESNAHIWAPDQNVMIKNEKGIWEPKLRGLILPDAQERSRQRSQFQGRMKPWSGPTYSREVIREKIKEREQRGVIISVNNRNKKIPTSDQDSTNYCWCYGVFSALNSMRAWRNLPYIEWSRESVCAVVKNGSNSGGWGIQALNRMVSHGMLPQAGFQRYSRNVSQYTTPEKLAEAAKYKVEEWIVVEDENFLEMMSALVEDHAAAVGYDWWSHEVCAVDPVIIGSTDLGIRIWNSWGNGYGDQGYAILGESKATAGDCVIPVVQLAA